MAGKLATDLSHFTLGPQLRFHNQTVQKRYPKKHKILKGLKSNNNIVILKPDKGNGVVVMDRSNCNQGLQKIIRDHTKLKQLKEDQTLKREKMLQRLLRKLKDNGHLDVKTYNNIYPKGSRQARDCTNCPRCISLEHLIQYHRSVQLSDPQAPTTTTFPSTFAVFYSLTFQQIIMPKIRLPVC